MRTTPINMAEAIIEPFWDCQLSGLSQWKIEDGDVHGLNVFQNWCWVGFDWARTEEVLMKVDEELGELKEASRLNDRAAIEEELGDLLFAVANLARFVSLCPEDALGKTIDKFQRRFQYIERELPKRGKKLGEASLEEMDELWEEVKQEEKEERKR